MTYNVEALFDAKHDAGKNDATYLPLSEKKTESHKIICAKARFKRWVDQCMTWDWSESLVNTKLKRIAKVIKQVNHGQGADILLLQEVENIGVLRKLNKDFNLGYKEIVLIEGRDLRGIDVAIMSKFKQVGKPSLNYVPFTETSKDRLQDSRGILQATFRLPDSSLITIFSAHFPAPFHPVQMRIDSLKYLTGLLKKLPKDRLAVAGGDFNIPGLEDRTTHILDKYAAKSWKVAHKEGCKGCRGTTYYAKKDTWSFLDILLVSKSIESDASWKFNPDSLIIPNKVKEQINAHGRPAEFNPETLEGVSDHWPLALELESK